MERRVPVAWLSRGACRLVVLAAGFVTPAGCGSESRGNLGSAPSAIPVQIVRAEASDLPEILAAVGSLVSPQSTVVSAEIAGTVAEFDIPEGRPVEAGHLLARLCSKRSSGRGGRASGRS